MLQFQNRCFLKYTIITQLSFQITLQHKRQAETGVEAFKGSLCSLPQGWCYKVGKKTLLLAPHPRIFSSM